MQCSRPRLRLGSSPRNMPRHQRQACRSRGTTQTIRYCSPRQWVLIGSFGIAKIRLAGTRAVHAVRAIDGYFLSSDWPSLGHGSCIFRIRYDQPAAPGHGFGSVNRRDHSMNGVDPCLATQDAHFAGKARHHLGTHEGSLRRRLAYRSRPISSRSSAARTASA
jgi:hypothetical protein